MTLSAALVMGLTADGRTLVGRRRADLAFLGGFTVFPGGAVDEADRALALLFPTLAGEDGPARIAALRELWEEAGLVVETAPVAAARAVPTVTPDAPVEAAYAARGASLGDAAARLHPMARWVTPAFSPIRFDTHCFALPLADADAPGPALGELEDSAWIAPGTVVERWHRFELTLAPPTASSLEALTGATIHDLDAAAARFAAADGAQGQDVFYFECVPGIRGLPLLTPTLPPALHTNTYLVGTARLLIVDPATYDTDERHKLLAELDAAVARGAALEAIVLTHHHGDHIGAASWLALERDLPILAHPITRELVAPRIAVTRTIAEGDVFQLGTPAAPFPVEVLFTPGHAPGHIVLADRRPGSRAMIVGDMVASIGTIIVDPPEGDMAEYLRQLRRLRASDPRPLLPAHGMPIMEGAAKLDQYVAHRLGREAKVRAALGRAGRMATPAELVPDAYADTPEALWPLAERSCLAHLLKLVADGEARADGDRFAARV